MQGWGGDSLLELFQKWICLYEGWLPLQLRTENQLKIMSLFGKSERGDSHCVYTRGASTWLGDHSLWKVIRHSSARSSVLELSARSHHQSEEGYIRLLTSCMCVCVCAWICVCVKYVYALSRQPIHHMSLQSCLGGPTSPKNHRSSMWLSPFLNLLLVKTSCFCGRIVRWDI